MSNILTPFKRSLAAVRLGQALWRGVMIAAPIAILLWIVYFIFAMLNSVGKKALGLFVADRYLFFGIGFLLMALIIFLIGRIDLRLEGSNSGFRQKMRHFPLIGPLITSGGGALCLEELGRLTPCKFWLSDTTPHYGFIIREQKIRGAETEIDVYRPNVPTIIPGDLMPLKKRFVIKLANPPAEILQKLASAGFLSADEEIPVKWDDETQESFLERINLTPLEIAVKRIMTDAHALRELEGGPSPQRLA
jgi:uncharacterized membrane protein